jgi:hypothetical protein
MIAHMFDDVARAEVVARFDELVERRHPLPAPPEDDDDPPPF